MPNISPYTASVKSRVKALLIDVSAAFLLKGFVTLVLEAIAGQPFSDPPPLAPFLIVYVAYCACSKYMMDRNTPGERWIAIAPITLAGQPVTTARWAIRVVFASFLWAGWMLLDTSPPRSIPVSATVVISYIVFLAFFWAIADIVFLLVSPSHRTVTDRILRIVVVNIPPPQPHRAPAGSMYSATDVELGVVAQPPKS